ncbi:MAG TPA: LysM peptidoglycan-binding domain-containing protein [Phycisphaerae bacterium]|jgi:nucleoid-associated protein YgaU|nr:LysM peptidoglycan-binding domain-containing protein [Phycisphaerae bacterium]HOB75415.1 LysM peptidoglycan-binding domain-containing protein [Phycisphaerae bacterium]HOJ55652.1 LysM peptidoglycan-binding domain-containing protein [Phycisphaerae bacterium]HOL27663.1 LysM peptidoglycan-binding domain-containing protein [Phycisphaerae bacterium]HPP21965.1 LysM peptidoglycan-binding domain-containing protein [Phycisphaerae bacterium]
MTRETKIGLLVGLGFIVVFAVLLSHNGTGPSPTQSLPPIVSNPIDADQQGGASLTTSIGNPAAPTGLAMDPSGSEPQWVDPINGGHVSADAGNDLPSPRFFDSSDMIASAPPSMSSEPLDTGNASSDVSEGMAMAAPRDALTLEGSINARVVPPVVEPPKPEPAVESVRSITPSVSPAPDTTSSPTAVASGESRDSGAQAAAGPAKEYVVKKGDALVNIARATYGKASPDVITFLVESNKGTIKNRDSLREGQTIVLPPLPPSMFETRTASASRSDVDLKKVEGLINGTAGARRAPEGKPEASAPKKSETAATPLGRPSLPLDGSAEFIRIGAERPAGQGASNAKNDAKDAKTDKGAKTDGKNAKPESKPKRSSKSGHRFYEVRPNDTFSSIAQRELGSKNRWVEIKQLNKDIDPLKMRPGTKIRIPSNESMSADDSTKQASA